MKNAWKKFYRNKSSEFKGVRLIFITYVISSCSNLTYYTTIDSLFFELWALKDYAPWKFGTFWKLPLQGLLVCGPLVPLFPPWGFLPTMIFWKGRSWRVTKKKFAQKSWYFHELWPLKGVFFPSLALVFEKNGGYEYCLFRGS